MTQIIGNAQPAGSGPEHKVVEIEDEEEEDDEEEEANIEETREEVGVASAAGVPDMAMAAESSASAINTSGASTTAPLPPVPEDRLPVIKIKDVFEFHRSLPLYPNLV